MDIRKNLFRHWNRLFGEMVESPPLEVFKRHVCVQEYGLVVDLEVWCFQLDCMMTEFFSKISDSVIPYISHSWNLGVRHYLTSHWCLIRAVHEDFQQIDFKQL